ncbi:MAG: STAS domain-containing protein [Lachnospiraceae bacterium]|nr:STAS domain-containing protein [Lachnospiraceae bacterium]
MDMNFKKNGEEMTVELGGRLDTTTAPDLETKLGAEISGVTNLIFDLEKLEYISSAGLRVLLSAQKIMNRAGNMTVRNANESIREIFDVTGFVEILNIE